MLRIKNQINIVLFLIPLLAISQNHLPKPDAAFLNRTDIKKPPIYEYFEKYIGSISGKKKQKKAKFIDSNKDFVCSWEEKFKKDIYFKFDSCSQTEIEITIDFVNYSKTEIVQLVNTFYKDQFSSWNEDKTIYQPVQEGAAGCYIEIKTINKHKKQLNIMCGE